MLGEKENEQTYEDEGTVREPLGSFLAPRGNFRGVFRRPLGGRCGARRRKGLEEKEQEAVLGASLNQLGAFLGRFWAVLEAILGVLEAIWDRLGAFLGPSWGPLGLS